MTTSSSPPPAIQPRGMAIALNAVRNASRVPATTADVEHILRSGHGLPSHVLALLGDVSFDTLA